MSTIIGGLFYFRSIIKLDVLHSEVHMYRHNPRTYCDMCEEEIQQGTHYGVLYDFQVHLWCVGELMHRIKNKLPIINKTGGKPSAN